MYKIKKYVCKIKKAIYERQRDKFDNYFKHLKYHTNIMMGGDSLDNKVNELENLLNELKKYPKFGINDTLEEKIKQDDIEVTKFNLLFNKYIKDILVDEKFTAEEIKKILS
jgi:hypothetical protein